ncbi:MAG: hypothetical protein ABW069_17815 [Duganella sp.]
MRNRHAMVATMAMVVILALACRMVLAQIGPRYAVEVQAEKTSSGGAGRLPHGRVELAGHGLALIRYEGLAILTVGTDADAYSADAVRHWPAADLLVVTPAIAGRYNGLAPLASLHGLGVVLPEPGGGVTIPPMTPGRETGPRYFPMQTWDALHLRKGRAQLRVTAMPGAPGTAQVGGFVLELGNGRASYRLYVSCVPLGDDELQALPQRLPGADLALLPLPAQPAPYMLALRRRPLTPAVLTPAGYAFAAIRR